MVLVQSEVVVLESQPQGEVGMRSLVYSSSGGLVTLVSYPWRLRSGGSRVQAVLVPLSVVDVTYAPYRGRDGMGELRTVEGVVGVGPFARGPKAVVQSFLSDAYVRAIRAGGRGIPEETIFAHLRESALAYQRLSVSELKYFPSVVLIRLFCVLGYRPSGRWSVTEPHLNLASGCFETGLEGRWRYVPVNEDCLSSSLSESWSRVLDFSGGSYFGFGDAERLLASVVRYGELHLGISLRSDLFSLFMTTVARM